MENSRSEPPWPTNNEQSSSNRLSLGGNFFSHGLPGRIVRVHVFIENPDELGDDAIALQRSEQPTVDIDRSLGSSNVPGSEMPMLACFDSPGPLTTQPITASFISSTPI